MSKHYRHLMCFFPAMGEYLCRVAICNSLFPTAADNALSVITLIGFENPDTNCPWFDGGIFRWRDELETGTNVAAVRQNQNTIGR